MLKDLGLLLIFASFEIVDCQKPPRMPYVYLPGQKFSLPPVCSNIAEWQDIALSLEILADTTEPKREKSAFISLMNLIKFILVKEELSCPVIQQMTCSGGKISNTVTSLQNSQIISKIEAALARKPAKPETVEINDHIDIPNMIPVFRARSKGRRKLTKPPLPVEAGNGNFSCPEAKVTQEVGSTFVGTTLTPDAASKPCQCSKCIPLGLKLAPLPSPQSKPCQRLQIVNLTPIMSRQSICQKCQNPRPVPHCQRNSIVTGCKKQSNPIKLRENQTVMTTTRNETIPLMGCYGNMLNQVTTRILVPYCLAKLA